MATKAPKHLKAPTRRWFEFIASEYLLESHHLRLLQCAAEAWDRGQEARLILDKQGLTFTDRHGNIRPRPEVNIERDSRVAFCRCLRELGLNVDEPGTPRPPTIQGTANLQR